MQGDTKRRDFLKQLTTHSFLLTLATTIDYSYLHHNQNLHLTEQTFETMGTIGKIQLFENCPSKTRQSLDRVIKKIFALEQKLSKFNINSDISILNRNPFVYHTTQDDTLSVLEKSIKYKEITHGYFDIGIGNLLSIAGIDNAIPLVGQNFLSINSKEKPIKIKNNKIKIDRQNSMIDLGGIAKGFIIDEAMKIFMEDKIKHVAIEIGGDIKVYGGTPNNKNWNITLNNGSTNNITNIHTGSISISGGYVKKAINNINNITHHIINPKDLTSKDYYKAVIVSGENSIDCDVLATAIYNINNKIKIKKNNRKKTAL